MHKSTFFITPDSEADLKIQVVYINRVEGLSFNDCSRTISVTLKHYVSLMETFLCSPSKELSSGVQRVATGRGVCGGGG